MYVLGIAPACLCSQLLDALLYSELLDALENFGPDCTPDKILLDFEIVAINAFQKYHPVSMLSGCYFHLTQIFVRKFG